MFRNRNVSMIGTDPFSTSQHIDVLSRRNKQEFLERMNAAAPVVEEIAEVRPSTWNQMKGLFSSMENVGRFNMVGSLVTGLQQGAMRPLNIFSNRISFMFERLTMPMLPYINQITNEYSNFIMDNQIGGTIGGLGGMAIGAYYGGASGAAVGGFLGGLIGSFIEAIVSPFLDLLGDAWSAFLNPGGPQLPTGDIIDIGEDMPVRSQGPRSTGGGHTIILPSAPIIRRPRPNRRI